jgi:hypothetical protein
MERAHALSREQSSLARLRELGDLLRSSKLVEKGSKADTALTYSELGKTLGISRSRIWRAVQLSLLYQRLPWLSTCKHLRAAHVCAVLGLPDQESVLRRAEEQRWSCKRLQSVVDERRRAHSGIRKNGDVCRALEHARSVLEDATRLVGETRELSPGDDPALASVLTDLEAECQSFRVVAQRRRSTPAPRSRR